MREKNLTYFQATKIILSHSEPLSLKEIERQILTRQLRDSVVASALRSVIYKDIYKGIKSTFCQNPDGLYTIREASSGSLSKEKDNSHDDKVLVFETSKLYQFGYFQGVSSDYKPYLNGLLDNDAPTFMPRNEAEEDTTFKQIVSYVMVKYKDHLLRFTRHKTKRNKFLDYVDGNYSIGFGGHVQESDLLFSKVNDSGFMASLERELFEESFIRMENVKSIKMIGVLNDDSTPRGNCHFAFIHLIELDTLSFKDNDKYVNDLKMVSFWEISEDFASYEWWSKLCLQHFFFTKLKFECFIDTKQHFKLRNNYKYLAVVGGIGSGKSQICSILTERYGYIHVPCSKILKGIIGSRLGNEATRHDLQSAGWEFITSPGAHEIFAERIVSYMEKVKDGHRYVIDGLRYPETLQRLREKLGVTIPVIFVETNKDMQYKNFKARENGAVLYDEFLRIVGHPVENQIQRFLPYSRIIVLNHGTLDSLGNMVIKYFERELVYSNHRIAWDANAKSRHEQILRGNDLTFSRVFVPEFLRQIEAVRNYQNATVLDIGCGTGILSEIIADRVQKVVGIDYSDGSIDIARNHSHKSKSQYECVPIEDYHSQDSFDIVISNMTFHTVENIQKVLENVFSLLVHEGRLIFTLPHPRYYPLRDRVKKIFLADGYNYEVESFHRIPFTISQEPDPLPSLTPYYHRPYHTYVNLLYKIGFMLVNTYIPFPDDETLELYSDKWALPHILLGVAKKP